MGFVNCFKRCVQNHICRARKKGPFVFVVIHNIYENKLYFFDDDENDSEEILDFDDWIEVENDSEEETNTDVDDVQEEENEEENYNKNDAVKKFQTDVGSSSFLMPENIQSKIDAKKKSKENKETEQFVFAPGEGQVPVNILRPNYFREIFSRSP